jgi:hypothetical protein
VWRKATGGTHALQAVIPLRNIILASKCIIADTDTDTELHICLKDCQMFIEQTKKTLFQVSVQQVFMSTQFIKKLKYMEM